MVPIEPAAQRPIRTPLPSFEFPGEEINVSHDLDSKPEPDCLHLAAPRHEGFPRRSLRRSTNQQLNVRLRAIIREFRPRSRP
jgi:hypothetical protein